MTENADALRFMIEALRILADSDDESIADRARLMLASIGETETDDDR